MEILFLGFVLFVSLLRLVKVIRVKPKVNCIPKHCLCTQRQRAVRSAAPAPSVTEDNYTKGSLKPLEQELYWQKWIAKMRQSKLTNKQQPPPVPHSFASVYTLEIRNSWGKQNQTRRHWMLGRGSPIPTRSLVRSLLFFSHFSLHHLCVSICSTHYPETWQQKFSWATFSSVS